MGTEPLLERLAALEHEQWAHWTKYMLGRLGPLFADPEHLTREQQLAAENIDRWRRQIETPYAELSEKEKDSDREWAGRVIDISIPFIQDMVAQIRPQYYVGIDHALPEGGLQNWKERLEKEIEGWKDAHIFVMPATADVKRISRDAVYFGTAFVTEAWKRIDPHLVMLKDDGTYIVLDEEDLTTAKVSGWSLLKAAAQEIVDARDYHADTGEYPEGTVDEDNQCFDDWAADVLSGAIKIIEKRS